MPRAPDPLVRKRRQRALDYRASVGWRCEDCGAAHGKLTDIGNNTMHRVELGIVHRNGKRDDWRWKNLRAVCKQCRPNYSPTFDAAALISGTERSLPPEKEPSHG